MGERDKVRVRSEINAPEVFTIKKAVEQLVSLLCDICWNGGRSTNGCYPIHD
jgi:hypothetical protein